jgi:hypothetical protein
MPSRGIPPQTMLSCGIPPVGKAPTAAAYPEVMPTTSAHPRAGPQPHQRTRRQCQPHPATYGQCPTTSAHPRDRNRFIRDQNPGRSDLGGRPVRRRGGVPARQAPQSAIATLRRCATGLAPCHPHLLALSRLRRFAQARRKTEIQTGLRIRPSDHERPRHSQTASVGVTRFDVRPSEATPSHQAPSTKHQAPSTKHQAPSDATPSTQASSNEPLGNGWCGTGPAQRPSPSGRAVRPGQAASGGW